VQELDGLRGLAILLVLWYHNVFAFGLKPSSRLLSAFLTSGKLTWSGVDLFFALSGFLIGGILLDARDSPRYFKTFYTRGACRIFPLYFLFTGCVLLIRHLRPFWLYNWPRSSMPALAYLTFTQNLWPWHVEISALVPTWSLCVEEQFYLTIPLAIRFLKQRHLVLTLVFILMGAPLLRLVLSPLPYGDTPCYDSMPCRADALALGVLAAILVRQKQFWQKLFTHRVFLRAGVFVLFLGMVYMTWRRYTQFQAPMTTIGLSWTAFFYAFVLLSAVSNPRGLFKRILCCSALTWLGRLAYCTYLIHYVFRDLGYLWIRTSFGLSDGRGKLLGGMIALPATFAVASLSWRFLEKPLLKLGHRFHY
jgi:peptidoglycan/LPS O-acetylase OafA/YrhL